MLKNYTPISFIPHILFVLAFWQLAALIHLQDPILVGAVIGSLLYIASASILKKTIPKSHNQALKHLKQLEFEKAITSFEDSYNFFKNHKWLDKFRFLAILSSSKLSYREMALLNMAYCYFQLGQKRKSIMCYHRILKDHPENKFAQKGLKKLALNLSIVL